MTPELMGKVGVITGASGGIGEAIAAEVTEVRVRPGQR